MSLGVALYLTGVGREFVERLWGRLATAGFSSPANTAGQRPHVSCINAYGTKEDALELAHELKHLLGATPAIECALGPLAYFDGPPRVAYLSVPDADPLRPIQRAIYDVAVSAGVSVPDRYSPAAWIPHCTIAEDIPVDRVSELADLLRDLPPRVPVVLEEAGVAQWEDDTALTRVAHWWLGGTPLGSPADTTIPV